MTTSEAQFFFFQLAYASHPTVTHLAPIAFWVSVILMIFVPIIVLLIRSITVLSNKWRVPWIIRPQLADISKLCLLLILLWFMFVGPRLWSVLSAGSTGVDIITSDHAGIYDIQVVRSKRSQDLADWLMKNGFSFNSSDTRSFDDYIENNWCFVVAKTNINPDNEAASNTQEGLVDPLILRFRASQAVYPLALTATGGFDTHILLYVLSNGKMVCDGPLSLHFANQVKSRKVDQLFNEIHPKLSFTEKEHSLSYLCKFKGTLSPDQMRNDLLFSYALNDRPIRKHEIRW